MKVAGMAKYVQFKGKTKKRKVFSAFNAFPTPSGDKHVGHVRGDVLTDIIARWEQLNGAEIFYPTGLHATGKDVPHIVEQLATKTGKEKYNIDDTSAEKILSQTTDIERYKTLLNLFKDRYLDTLKALNIAITEDAFFTTADSAFHAYTLWAMRKLKDKKLIDVGKRPVPWCDECAESKEIESSEAGIKILEGKAGEERIEKYTLIKFRDELKRSVVIATKKPETIFQATNLWINPLEEYVVVRYHRSKHPDQEDTMIVAKEGLAKLVTYYHLNVLEENKITSEELTSLKLENPVTGEKMLPVLSANFVKASQGTGIVMSVPTLDPHDYRYHHDNNIDISLEGRLLIKSRNGESLNVDDQKGYGGIKGLTGTLKEQILAGTPEQLEILKTQMYREQNMGRITQGKYAEMSVPAARGKLIEDMLREQIGNEIDYLENIEAVCKSHQTVNIRLARQKEPFVKLGNRKWQDTTASYIESHLKTTPNTLKEQLLAREEEKGIIRTRRDKSCKRNAKGHIGTPIPTDVIITEKPSHFEALADSNVYMEYYKIAQFLSRGMIQEEQLSEALFDYLFLDIGNRKELAASLGVSVNKIKEMKREIDATYPVGLNTAGTEHESVHIPYSLAYHAAILPEKFFPREYLMHGLVTRRATDKDGNPTGRPAKMGKSKGNAISLKNAIEHAQHFFYADTALEKQSESLTISLTPQWTWKDTAGKENKIKIKELFSDERAGVDLLRYFTARGNKIADDFEWDDKTRDGLYKRGRDVVKHLTTETFSVKDKRLHPTAKNEELTELDQWLLSKMHGYIALATSLFQERKLRKATIVVSDLMTNTYNTYKARNGKHNALLYDYLKAQLTLLYPVMPTVTARLYHELSNKESMGTTPLADKAKINLDLEFRLDYPTEQDQKSLLDGIRKTIVPYISYGGRVDNVGLLKESPENNVIKIYLPSAAEVSFLEQRISFISHDEARTEKRQEMTRFEYIQQSFIKPLTGKKAQFELSADPTVTSPYIVINDEYIVDFARGIKPRLNSTQTTSKNLSPVE